MRREVVFTIADIPDFKNRLLQWATQFRELSWLDSNQHQDRFGNFEGLLAVDAQSELRTGVTDAFKKLQAYQKSNPDWLFGYLSYDLKNDVEALNSHNHDGLGFPELHFFCPKKVVAIKGDQAWFYYTHAVQNDIEADFNSIRRQRTDFPMKPTVSKDIRIKMRIFKDEYHRRAKQLLRHIHRGDLYEANFCQEFYAENTRIDPLRTYLKLNSISKAPFSCFLRLNERYLLCASPERYLKKHGQTVISQPIKGTAKRAKDVARDNALKKALEQDEKERAENIMIVDLVRNDLSKTALLGSVTVEALCEVTSFEQVHQMISTVSAKVHDDQDPVTLLKNTFPMGSMTGAPKVSAMQIIEALESFKRGVYSGAVGYFTPSGDFDFNVVIRSILYNDTNRYVSFSVGSAITAKAIPEKEYEECLLKAKAMRQVLEDTPLKTVRSDASLNN
ncbi:anthranilate synthase component I family protein [Maribacter sp. 2-571]|uniref:anthranilate synthase component I family protein n=1 Tax=Maribacter sp. 2-571 TaxID=3417569 RepID=UPI003D354805